MEVESKSVTTLGSGRFFGDVDRALALGGLRLSIVRHDRPRAIELHEHEWPYFCFLVTGEYEETHKGATIHYEPFSIAFHPARFVHSDEILKANTTFFAIELGPDWESRLEFPLDTSAWRLELQHGDCVWLALQVLSALLEDAFDDRFAVDALVSEMVGIALRLVDRENQPRVWVPKVRERLQQEFADGFSLAELAHFAGVHPASLARGFRLDEGVTIGEYVNRLRVQHACRLMTEAKAKLADVALACGFADQSHLTRVFKTITGMTPSMFRHAIPY
jgi:AraC family transcriptional regulator